MDEERGSMSESSGTPMLLTFRFRLRDTSDSELRRQARAVNFVWNYCNETQRKAIRRGDWLSKYDLQKLTAGASKYLDIHAHTIQGVCRKYSDSRKIHGKPWLSWRSNKKSLGWVPFNKGHVVYRSGAFWFRGRAYKAWISRDLREGQTFGAGSFNQDSQGRWYINLPTYAAAMPSPAGDAIGVDLGLKEIAAISDGSSIENPGFYRRGQERLAKAQRARRKKQTRKLHAKIRNQRNDFLHKASTDLVRKHKAIFVGNVSPSAIAATKLAKSSLDAGWAIFKQQLHYKAIRHGVLFAVVNEAYSTQTCSSCGSVEGPKGIAGLGIRQWTCSCGVEHDRDTNAARNIARRGLATLAEGASA